MTNKPDYKIQELFDFEKMQPYYRVLKLWVTGDYAFFKQCDNLEQAQYCVRMARKYKNEIFHYVED